jgi:hypothetical protein
LGPEGRYLFFTFDRAIRRLDLRTGTQRDVAIPGGQGIGTDGLYLHDGSLVAIQPRRRRVVTLQLNQELDTVVSVSLLARDHPDFAYPTTGVLVRDTLFLVATSFADRPRTDGPGPQHPDVLIQGWALGAATPALEPIAKTPSDGSIIVECDSSSPRVAPPTLWHDQWLMGITTTTDSSRSSASFASSCLAHRGLVSIYSCPRCRTPFSPSPETSPAVAR